MKKQKLNFKKIFKKVIFSFIFVFAFPLFVFALPSSELTYHGKLTDLSDVPVADGNYNFVFKIFDASSGGTCLWVSQGSCGSPTTKSIAVSKGIFYTILGESGDNALTLDFNADYWLEIKVGTNSPMTPRRKITGNNFSLNSGKLNGQSSSYFLDTSATEQTKSGNLNLSSNLKLTGIFKDKDGDAGTSGQVLSSTGSATDWVNASSSSPAGSNTQIQFNNSSSFGADSNFVWDNTNKRLGVGVSSPLGKLHVSSSTVGDSELIVEADTDNNDEGDNSRIIFVQDGGIQESSIGQFDNILELSNGVDIGGGILFSTSAVDGWSTANSRMFINSVGNIGIGTGTTDPTARLQVKGSTSNNTDYNLKLDNSSNTNLLSIRNDGAIMLPQTTNASKVGVIYKDGNSFIHNFNYGNNGTVTTSGNNTFIGENAGNLTMGSTATSVTQSSYNTGIGWSSLSRLTTGFYNSAVGYASLFNNTSGFYNSALGLNSLYSNLSGYSNSVIGMYSLYGNTTGYNNSALGYSSGRFIADGSTANQTSNTSVYLGSETKAFANGDTNEIVIGYNTIGKGSNTVNIGNSSITNTYLNGQLNLTNYKFPTADGTVNQVLKTDGAGTLSFVDTGSLLAYGEMYQNDNVVATTINTIDIWEEVNNFSAGELNLVTFANSDLTVTGAGKYHLNASVSGVPQTANDVFEFAVSVNDTIITKTKAHRKFSSSTDAGSVSLNGILNLNANDVVKLEMRNTTGADDFTIENCNLTLNKL